MLIGDVRIPNSVVSAPMAGVTDKTSRLLAREAGCGLIYTEMVSDKALIYANKRTEKLINLEGEKPPITVQIFGSNPEIMAEAAELVVAFGANIIDINMGCPAPKIVRNCEGSALMRDLPLARKIIKAVVNRVSLPVTVKMRKGWDDASINALELATIAEDEGVAAITVHGRTRAQYYSGLADWEIIKSIKNRVKIPVIGNGDIWIPQDAKRMLEVTGCDGVMIGRGSMGNPWIYKRTATYLETGQLLPEPSDFERIQMALRHLDMIIEDKGEHLGVREMRKHAAWYLKGMKDSAKVRDTFNHANTKEEFEDILLTYKATLKEKD